MSPVLPAEAKTRGRPRDERASRAIADAVMRQLNELGFAQMTMDGVAAEAGVARTTIYRRFQDRADLVTAVIAGQAPELPEGPSEDPRGDLIRFLSMFDESFGELCLEVIGSLLGSREDPQALELHRRRVVEPRSGYARGLLVRAQELGQIDPKADLDLALQMLVGSVFARRVKGTPASRGWATRAVDAIWRGMAPQHGPGG